MVVGVQDDHDFVGLFQVTFYLPDYFRGDRGAGKVLDSLVSGSLPLIRHFIVLGKQIDGNDSSPPDQIAQGRHKQGAAAVGCSGFNDNIRFQVIDDLLIYNQIGLNLIALLVGVLTSLFHFALYWNRRIQRYDAIAKKPVVRYVSKIKSLRGLLTIIILLLRISVVLLLSLIFLPRIFEFDFKSAISIFISGLWFLMWGFYFQLIYWEKKNHMKIYIKRENSFEKMYAVGEKEGKL